MLHYSWRDNAQLSSRVFYLVKLGEGAAVAKNPGLTPFADASFHVPSEKIIILII